MQSRRSVLTVLGAGIASLSGCGLLNDTIEAEADPAGVGQSALESASYQHEQTTDFPIERTIEVEGTSRDVKLTNWIAAYRKSLTGVESMPGQFSAFSSPTISIANQDVNPLRRMDEEQLLQMLVEQSGTGIEDIQAVGERGLTILDDSVTITKYEGTTKQEGFDVFLHFGTLTHDGDFLAVLGVHPTQVDETANVDALAEGTEHPVPE